MQIPHSQSRGIQTHNPRSLRLHWYPYELKLFKHFKKYLTLQKMAGNERPYNEIPNNPSINMVSLPGKYLPSSPDDRWSKEGTTVATMKTGRVWKPATSGLPGKATYLCEKGNAFWDGSGRGSELGVASGVALSSSVPLMLSGVRGDCTSPVADSFKEQHKWGLIRETYRHNYPVMNPYHWQTVHSHCRYFPDYTHA